MVLPGGSEMLRLPAGSGRNRVLPTRVKRATKVTLTLIAPVLTIIPCISFLYGYDLQGI